MMRNLRFKCPECGPIAESGRGWKRHMTHNHDGYTPEQLQAVLAEVGGEEGAAAMGGAKNFLEAAANAPATDRIESVEPVRRGRRSKDEIAQEQARNEFAREMAKVLCNSLARRPYDIVAWLIQRPDFALSDQEAEPLVAAYQRLVEIFGVQFASKWWAVIAVLDANFVALRQRLPIIKDVLAPVETSEKGE